jgi:hypothetical protein
MIKVEPYRTGIEASLALDNGGRFFNILTKENDGEISLPELSKVAGVFGEKQKMILFLDLALSKLSDGAKKGILSALSSNLIEVYEKHQTVFMLPSEAVKNGVIATNVIVTGVPRLIESKTEFNGFIMIPIMAGKVMTFIMVPLVDEYDVYEIRDHATHEAILVAHAKGTDKLPERNITIAGVLKELKKSKAEKEASGKFLVSYYYLDC